MAKSKHKQRQRRSERERKRKARRREKRQREGEGGTKRAREPALADMKRAPPPEFAPSLILLGGALLAVILVRAAPAWPWWGHLLAWALLGVSSRFAARATARRRVPRWDPYLFFGTAAVFGTIAWFGDAGSVWVVHPGASEDAEAGPVSWRVDLGLPHRASATERSRIYVRHGEHRLVSPAGEQRFFLARDEDLLLSVGGPMCVQVGERRLRGEKISVPAGKIQGPPRLCADEEPSPAAEHEAAPAGGDE